ncbi:hypothetical protein ZWY2020_057580 [Hordeum vulgare]|nr:hypothetical protein ZWY2020_057580 [Hordeum vulgare]
MEDTTQPPQQQEEAQPAGEKRKREEDEAPEASAGDAAPASAPAGEEATAAAPTGEGARHPMSKTSLCSFFRRRGGGPDGCNHGEACRYAHTEEELRPRPDGTWDPTSDRAKKLRRVSEEDGEAVEEEKRGRWGQEEVTIDDSSLDKCLVGLSRHWLTDRLKSFLDEQGISYAVAKKKKGMTVGFVTFETVEQLKNAVEVLKENRSGGKQIKIADANRRSHQKLHSEGSNTGPEAGGGTKKNCRGAVTPYYMTYSDQLEHKKSSVAQLLKKLTRNAKKACPADVTLPDWISNAKQIGGLSCKLEGILESPVIDGYRNKCEFSVGHSLAGKKTVGFMLGNFREGVTAVEEPVDCPNVSALSCKYAMMFQDFLQLSCLPAWNRVDNSGFWRQFTFSVLSTWPGITVYTMISILGSRGRSPAQAVVAQDTQTQISEVMIIIQVCSTGVDEAQMKDEFAKLTKTLVQGAATCLPPLPLTTIVVQKWTNQKRAVDKTRIHDHISNLRFSLSPTAFFQVNTLAAERLYTLAGDWANLNSDTLLFDVCCGTGTIGLTLAHRVGMVVGIEMNESAVVDAQRNALINGIKNCRFVCGKAEDVMGSLLTEYLGSPQQHIAASESNSEVNAAGKKEDIVDGAENNGKSMDSLTEENDNGESQQLGDKSANHPTCSSKELEGGHEQCNEAVRNQNSEEASSLVNDESVDAKAADGSEHIKTSNNDVLAAIGCQFKNFVAIVDPPRAGLHPTVIKVLRTHPYISCNPDTLVANAIELCTPSTEHREKNKGHRGWRNMSSAGLARQRTKSMPNSEPFVPKRAMAVDLFPHTSHCEMVMLLRGEQAAIVHLILITLDMLISIEDLLRKKIHAHLVVPNVPDLELQ